MLSSGVIVEDERFRRVVMGNVRLGQLYEGRALAKVPPTSPLASTWSGPTSPMTRSCDTTKTDGSVSVFEHKGGHHNGQSVDLEGRLISCEHGQRCVSRTEPDGRRTVLAHGYEGKRLNSPNAALETMVGGVAPAHSP